jgi:transcriptional/translational regulatory protein YebC/TACO1
VDINNNYPLKEAIENARKKSVPRSIIEKTFTRAKERNNTDSKRNLLYEIVTPKPYSGALLVDTSADNQNDVKIKLKKILSKRGYSLSEKRGTVTWMFDNLGVVEMEKASLHDELLESALQYIEDVIQLDDKSIIISPVESYKELFKLIVESGIALENLEGGIHYLPKKAIEAEEKYIEDVKNLIEMLYGIDEVVAIYNNFKALNKYLYKQQE